MNHNMNGTPVWGFWGTTLWSLVIVGVFVAIQTGVALLFVGLPTGGNDEAWTEAMLRIESNGRVLAWATIATFLIGTPLVFLIAKLKSGASVVNYLALKGASLKAVILSIIVIIALIIITDSLNHLSGRPVVPEFMKSIYQSVGSIWLLAFAVVIAAPIFEEVFVRGFLISGLKETFLGSVGAVILSSLLFAVAHQQYDYINLGVVFLIGLVLGAIRVQTGSLYLVIFLHMMVNLIALVQTKFALGV